MDEHRFPSSLSELNTTLSACGKFLLAGEHSIVYSGQALSFPIPSLRLRLSEIPANQTPGLYVNRERVEDKIWEKVKKVQKIIGASSQQLENGLAITTEIPLGSGLGSSAALCVLLAKSYHPELPIRDIGMLALEGEKVFHEKPSGVDPFTVALEQPIVYRSGEEKTFRFLDTSKILAQGLCFAIANTGSSHETSEVVQSVLEMKKKKPAEWNLIMRNLSQNVEKMIEAVETDPQKKLGALMSDSHEWLQRLGVSSPALDSLVHKMLRLQALGAKLTGAGKGGCVLGLFHKSQVGNLPDQFRIVFG